MKNNVDKFFVKFWGVRGSIPCPSKDTIKYGGNTSCVELRAGDNFLILDGGTGLRLLGRHVLNEMPLTAHIFLSHLHWDHIQGIPFFEPAFFAGNRLYFYGRRGINDIPLEEYLVGQMRDPHFPIPMHEMKAEIIIREIEPHTYININEVKVIAIPLNHPGGSVGYRIEFDQKYVAYITDTEHLENTLDQNVLELAYQADLLIYDATYTEEEYLSGKKGWGHSTWQQGVRIAKASGAKKLALFHHDPLHTDSLLDKIQELAQKEFAHTCVAQEGMEITLL